MFTTLVAILDFLKYIYIYTYVGIGERNTTTVSSRQACFVRRVAHSSGDFNEKNIHGITLKVRLHTN